MKCSKCSVDVDEKEKICPNCGNNLTSSEGSVNNNSDDNNSDEELSTSAKLLWTFVFTAIGIFLFGGFILKFILTFIVEYVVSSGCY